MKKKQDAHNDIPDARNEATCLQRLVRLGLSYEAAEIAVGMIQHCIQSGQCMGMDEGFDESRKTRKKYPWRIELEQFVGLSD